MTLQRRMSCRAFGDFRWLVIAWLSIACWSPIDLFAQSRNPLTTLEKQANALSNAGRYQDAEKLYRQMLAAAKRDYPDEPAWAAAALSDLSGLYSTMGRFPEAESLARESLQILEQHYGADHFVVAEPLTNLANILGQQNRFAEAEKMHRRAWRLRLDRYGRDDPRVADSIDNLANQLSSMGRFAEAKPLYREALRIRGRNFGAEHHEVAKSIYNIGHFYQDQNRYEQAEASFTEAGRIWEKLYGPEHPHVIDVSVNLGRLARIQDRFDEAEKHFRKVLELSRKTFGADHPYVLGNTDLADIYIHQKRYADAEQIYRRALAFQEQYYGAHSESVAVTCHDLGRLAYLQERPLDAIPLMTRAIQIVEGLPSMNPAALMEWYSQLAMVQFALGKTDAASTDLLKSVELAEVARTQVIGGERERGESFEGLQTIYRAAVMMFAGTGQPERAFEISELNRSRALVEQMTTAHVDLLAGLPAEQAKQLRDAETRAKAQVTALEQQIQVLVNRTDLGEDQREKQAKELVEQLGIARRRLVDAHAAIRTASPRYRLATHAAEKVPLSDLRAWLRENDALLLYFMLGEASSHVLAIDGSDQPIGNHEFELNDQQVQGLGLDSGILTLDHVKSVMMNERSTGILQQLADHDSANAAEERLHLLWQVLITQNERDQIVAGKYKHLIIIPDGALALLPFETLVVETGEEPKYLMDCGVSIHYGPSPTVLYRLAHRAPESTSSTIQPVLAVGDPAYASGAAVEALGDRNASFKELRSRYGGYGGKLTRLPYSGKEASWVAAVFKQNGIAAAILKEEQATEANVRYNVKGRRIVHLACHGLADQSYDNFFGALALAPSTAATANPADDGFLTLNEICQLDLRSCELALLSACETNYGPQQYGEGIWALTRGFLVAGSQRVVASNWVVDDEAAASLISYYCSIIAKDQKEGRAPDYARALGEAKQFIRSQPRWKHPYYWATFVLVGPN